MDIQNNPSGLAGGLSIEEYLDQDEKKSLLRLLTAGSVDDGKSTLIGRLLYDSKKLYEDQLSALERDSKRVGNAGAGEIDYALLLDGLKAEREQGITIDVAYRYFSTNKRKFIIADTPGHEQYTRNMITGGSTASLAILLVDARTGVITQTRRHTFLCSLLGIKTIALAVNKMDLVDFDEAVYRRIVADYKAFVAEVAGPDTRVQCFPLSAKDGDNVVEKSARTPWYDGPALLDFLETVRPTPGPSLRRRGEVTSPIEGEATGSASNESLAEDEASAPLPSGEGQGVGLPFRFPVQYVLRPNLNFRGFCGKVASGVVRKGDEVMALPSRKTSRVKSIVTYEGELDYAFPPQCVTLTLEDEIDISRGEMIVKSPAVNGGEEAGADDATGASLPHVGRHFEAHLVWMDEERMDRSKSFFIKQTTNTSRCRIDQIKYKVDVNTLEHSEVEALQLNEIGRVVITTAKELMYDAYAENRQTGAFVVIDPITNNTAAVGMIVAPVEETDLLSGDLALPTLDLPALGIGAEHYAAIETAVESLRKQGLEVKVVK